MAAPPPKSSLGCGYVVCAVLLALGAAAVWGAFEQYGRTRDSGRAVVLGAFGVLLAGAGVALVGPMRRHAQRQAAEARRRAEHPHEPWRWKDEWSRGAIDASPEGGAVQLWFFAAVWNAVSWPAAWAVLMQRDVPAWVNFVFLFPVIGLWLLGSAIYRTVQAAKFGRPRFVPSTLPGNLGGYLGGVIEVPARVTPEADAVLRLSCVRRVTTGSGKNRSTRETVLWEREERLRRERWQSGPGGTQIPVLFHLPADAAATDFANSDNEVVWRLGVEAAVAGVDFSARFVVPVFATGETAPPPAAGEAALEDYAPPALDEATLRRSGVVRGVGTWEFHTSHLTGSRLAFTLLAIALVVFSVGLARGGTPAVAQIGVGIFTLLFVALAAGTWSRGFVVALEGEEVVVTRRGWIRDRVTRLPRRDVARVEARKSMSVGEKEYYRLSLFGRDGVDRTGPAAGEHFDARKLRYRLERVAKELGVSDTTKLGERGAEILEAMARTPRFRVEFAASVPGRANAESIGAALLAEIRGG